MVEIAIKETVCSCEKCVAACKHRPGWPTPQEVQKAIDAGMAGRYMIDYWVGNSDSDYSDVDILCPALIDCEGKRAPYWPTGTCTFLTDDDKCEIHELGFKPLECRAMNCGKDGNTQSLHGEFPALWDTEEGKRVVENWIKAIRKAPQ